jgi:hypothetical protein
MVIPGKLPGRLPLKPNGCGIIPLAAPTPASLIHTMPSFVNWDNRGNSRRRPRSTRLRLKTYFHNLVQNADCVICKVDSVAVE